MKKYDLADEAAYQQKLERVADILLITKDVAADFLLLVRRRDE